MSQHVSREVSDHAVIWEQPTSAEEIDSLDWVEFLIWLDRSGPAQLEAYGLKHRCMMPDFFDSIEGWHDGSISPRKPVPQS